MLELRQINSYTEYEHETEFQKDRKIPFPLKRNSSSQKESTLQSQLRNIAILCTFVGTAVAQWLRCCATNRKVAGSIPDGVIGIFH